MALPLTQQDLDHMGCEHCDKGAHPHHAPVILTGRCHQGAPTVTQYDSDTGCLDISCSVCQQPIASILVAYNSDLGLDEEH